MQPVIAFWSGGKDSALTLDRVRREGRYNVVALVTTINEQFQRVSMHGVREELVEQQAQALGISLHKMYVGSSSSNDEYSMALHGVLQEYKEQGITTVIFGDIFLEDLRQWREGLLTEFGMTGVFPLWKENTRFLVQEFIERRFKALICCIDDACLDEQDVGCHLDEQFIRHLPADVDPCGENGEYHSFVYDGPIFRQPVAVTIGRKMYSPLAVSARQAVASGQGGDPIVPLPSPPDSTRTRGFWFVDLLSALPEMTPAT